MKELTEFIRESIINESADGNIKIAIGHDDLPMVHTLADYGGVDYELRVMVAPDYLQTLINNVNNGSASAEEENFIDLISFNEGVDAIDKILSKARLSKTTYYIVHIGVKRGEFIEDTAERSRRRNSSMLPWKTDTYAYSDVRKYGNRKFLLVLNDVSEFRPNASAQIQSLSETNFDEFVDTSTQKEVKTLIDDFVNLKLKANKVDNTAIVVKDDIYR